MSGGTPWRKYDIPFPTKGPDGRQPWEYSRCCALIRVHKMTVEDAVAQVRRELAEGGSNRPHKTQKGHAGTAKPAKERKALPRSSDKVTAGELLDDPRVPEKVKERLRQAGASDADLRSAAKGKRSGMAQDVGEVLKKSFSSTEIVIPLRFEVDSGQIQDLIQGIGNKDAIPASNSSPGELTEAIKKAFDRIQPDREAERLILMNLARLADAVEKLNERIEPLDRIAAALEKADDPRGDTVAAGEFTNVNPVDGKTLEKIAVVLGGISSSLHKICDHMTPGAVGTVVLKGDLAPGVAPVRNPVPEKPDPAVRHTENGLVKGDRVTWTSTGSVGKIVRVMNGLKEVEVDFPPPLGKKTLPASSLVIAEATG